MVDLAEEVTDIKLRNMSDTLDEPDPKPFHRLRRRPLRPKPIRTRSEVRFENGFQHDLGRRWATRSRTVGIPNGRLPPCGFGMSTRLAVSSMNSNHLTSCCPQMDTT